VHCIQVTPSQRFSFGVPVAFSTGIGAKNPLTLRIDRISGRRTTRIRVCGEFRVEHIDQVKAELSTSGTQVALDLDEVDLLDVECVRFLNKCQAEGISMLRCSPYIKEWMLRERKGNGGNDEP
jgi:hypothetical protein